MCVCMHVCMSVCMSVCMCVCVCVCVCMHVCACVCACNWHSVDVLSRHLLAGGDWFHMGTEEKDRRGLCEEQIDEIQACGHVCIIISCRGCDELPQRVLWTSQAGGVFDLAHLKYTHVKNYISFCLMTLLCSYLSHEIVVFIAVLWCCCVHSRLMMLLCS